MGAIFTVMCFTYNGYTAGICLIIMALASVLSFAFYAYMTLWNSGHYIEAMPDAIAQAEKDEQEAAAGKGVQASIPNLVRALQRLQTALEQQQASK